MNTHHCFVSALDIGEQLPFTPKETHDMKDHLVNEQHTQNELQKFIKMLQKDMGEKIFHLGVDSIDQKSYHRFMFAGPGFLEIMVGTPIAISAHFHNKSRAKKYHRALVKTLKKVLPEGRKRTLFLNSITVEDEHHIPLSIASWTRIKKIRNILHRSVSLAIISFFVFLIIESVKAGLTELFSAVAEVHQAVIIVIAAIVIAGLFRPIEKVSEHVVSSILFRKS